MLRIAKQSRLKTDEILAKASRYFEKGGEGLDETERAACCISFSGAGGYVTVAVCEQTNQREVEVPGKVGTPLLSCVLFEKKSCYVSMMPRRARIDAPGALHHVICRGIERREIFG